MDGTSDVENQGGLWLIEPMGRQSIFTPEQFTEEQLAFAKTASDFALGKVLPRVADIEKKTPGVLKELLSVAGELGLLMLDVPETYGGLGTDKTTSMLVTEQMVCVPSW